MFQGQSNFLTVKLSNANSESCNLLDIHLRRYKYLPRDWFQIQLKIVQLQSKVY